MVHVLGDGSVVVMSTYPNKESCSATLYANADQLRGQDWRCLTADELQALRSGDKTAGKKPDPIPNETWYFVVKGTVLNPVGATTMNLGIIGYQVFHSQKDCIEFEMGRGSEFASEMKELAQTNLRARQDPFRPQPSIDVSVSSRCQRSLN
jgi:hypothetical protein